MYESIYKRKSVCKELCLLFAVLFLPSILAQTGNIDPTAFNNPLYHLQLLIVAVPQIFLVLYILELQPSLDKRRFGLRGFRFRLLPRALLIGASSGTTLIGKRR